jgi:hypothetical protein
MKRFQLLVLVSAITAAGIWYGFYRSGHTSSVAVASLLPKETLALVHLPDFNRAREEWHRTDLYQLWMEPAVQDFVAKPRSKIPGHGQAGQTVEEIETIGMKDAFLALLSVEEKPGDVVLAEYNNALKIVGGFRCTGDPDKAEKILHDWKVKVLGQESDFKHETAEYQGHPIHTDSAGILKLSTARTGQWFFAANSIEDLRQLIDRADGRVKDPNTALSASDVFLAASKHMPSNYAALAYAHVDQFVEKLAPAAEPAASPSADRLAMLRQIRSLCAATSFDGVRIRDTIFAGMPKVADSGNLNRASLSIGTKETFLYAASVLNLTKEMELGPQAAGAGWLSGLLQITDSLSANGITLDEWKSAFGPELGVIGDWPANARWPSLFLTLPVRDSVRANRIVAAATKPNADGASWSHQEREGVDYYSGATSGGLFSFSPTIGVSDRMLVAGAETNAVEAAMKRSVGGSSALAASKKFQDAERTLPAPQQAFAFVDLALFYGRFDSTLRPFLVMGAAFMPSIADTVDLSKLPDAETITRHLNPIVMSQWYDRDGYVAESVGPIPLYQTILAAVVATTARSGFYQSQMLAPQRATGPAKTPASRPAPSATPDNSP